jgi:MFS family permease
MLQVLKDRFDFMNRNITVLTLRQVFGMFFRRMVMSYSSLFVLAVGGTDAQIGLINSLRPLAGLIMFPIAGYLTDIRGRVKMIALAGYLTGITMLLYVFAQSWEWIALGAVIQGFMVFQFPPTSAILADSLEPRNRGIGIATMSTLANVFAIVSPYLAGYILEIMGIETGMRLLYGLLASVQLINGTLVIKYLEETAKPKETEKKIKILKILKETYAGIPDLVSNMSVSVKALGLVVGISFIMNGIASPFWVVYATKEVGLTEIGWGLILLIESIIKTALMIPAGIISDRYSRSRSLLAAVVFCLLAYPLTILAKSFFHIIVIRIIIGISGAIYISSSTALMADYVPRHMRGRIMAAIGRGSVLVGAAGGGTGGPGMGYLFTIPVMISSIVGGLLYSINPVYVWYSLIIASVIQVILVFFFISDPENIQV